MGVTGGAGWSALHEWHCAMGIAEHLSAVSWELLTRMSSGWHCVLVIAFWVGIHVIRFVTRVVWVRCGIRDLSV